MVSRRSVLAAALALLGSASCAAARPQQVQAQAPDTVLSSEPWARNALADLAAMRSLLGENHPGPVDRLNPGYGKWLDDGYRQAAAFARQAKSAADYDRALSLYVNGFRDLHVNWWMNDPLPKVWPGFLVADVDQGRIEVTAASPVSPVAVKSRLMSCDGMAASKLLQAQVYRFKVNPDIPHLAPWWAPELLVRYADDGTKPRKCRFRTLQGFKQIRLQWMPISNEEAAAQLKSARPFPAGELGIRAVGDIYLIAIPSFHYPGDNVSRIKAFMAELEEKRDRIRAAGAVIVDVRGNTGGNSAWGQQAAEILWDAARVEPIVNSFDWSHEFRTSPKIEARWRAYADAMHKAGEREQADRNLRIAQGVEAARAEGKALWFNPNPAKSSKADYPKTTPFKNRVFFLTDERCASACLDFADILTRLPGVTHIGRRTLADAIYIDNLAEKLPSGLATFTWSAKVYRNRVRGNNQWYTPKHLLHREQMTTEAVVDWVRRARTSRN